MGLYDPATSGSAEGLDCATSATSSQYNGSGDAEQYHTKAWDGGEGYAKACGKGGPCGDRAGRHRFFEHNVVGSWACAQEFAFQDSYSSGRLQQQEKFGHMRELATGCSLLSGFNVVAKGLGPGTYEELQAESSGLGFKA